MNLDHIRNAWRAIPDAGDEDARVYAAGMHKNPFDHYHGRAATFGLKGDRMLDAGCGMGTWAFAFASFFAIVDGCDISEPRIELADATAKHLRIPNCRFQKGDVLALPYEDAAFDFVFCYGVVISYIPISEVLVEFRRVLKPDGKLYLGLNGIGWSIYLRDERGAKREVDRVKGLRGLYNTLAHSDFDVTPELIRRTIWPALPPGSTVAKAKKIEGVPGGASDVFRAISDKRITDLAERIRQACGEDYASQFADDLIRIGTGNRQDFSFTKAGRGYDPAYVEKALSALEFTDVRWAAEGRLFETPKHLITRDKSYNGHVKNFEVIATKAVN